MTLLCAKLYCTVCAWTPHAFMIPQLHTSLKYEQANERLGQSYLHLNISNHLLQHTLTQKLSADDLISINVSDFEHTYNESDFTSVRQELLNRSTGQRTLAAWLPVERGVSCLVTRVDKKFDFRHCGYFNISCSCNLIYLHSDTIYWRTLPTSMLQLKGRHTGMCFWTLYFDL